MVATRAMTCVRVPGQRPDVKVPARKGRPPTAGRRANNPLLYNRHAFGARAYASPLLQDTVGAKDFFEKISIQRGSEAFLGDAQLGRVGLQQR